MALVIALSMKTGIEPDKWLAMPDEYLSTALLLLQEQSDEE